MPDQLRLEPENSLVTCRASDDFAAWLSTLDGSLAVTTYQAGKLAFIGWRGNQPMLLMRDFDKPMGLAVSNGQLALATRNEVIFLANAPLLAAELDPKQPGHFDAIYLPRASFYTGDLNVHDVAFAGDDLWIVASRFCCLAGLSTTYCFVPRWKPPYLSEIVPEDRCHLNGLAVVGETAKYVTALGETDVVGGWREKKATGGVLIDVETNEILVRGLSMPHSPRWHADRLWLLNSGAGELLCYNPASGEAVVVAVLPAYLRGLCLIGKYAVVGMCQIREKHIFGGLPIQNRFKKLLCGVAVIDLQTGRTAGSFEFTSGCTEIYDVQFLSQVRTPNVLNSHDDVVREAFPAPDFSYWLRPSNVIPTES